MSNYSKTTDFASKDALASGNANKIVKGTEIDDEFNAIQTAIATKANTLSPTLTGTPLAPTAAPGTNTTQISTTAFVKAALQALHPVGSIYIAVVSTNPATLFGFGTWVAFGAGRTIVGIDTGDASFNTAEGTGGSKDAIVVSHSHTGTTESNGEHAHTQMSGAYDTDTGNNGPKGSNSVAGVFTYTPQQNTSTSTASAGAHAHTITTDSTGTSGTNANLPPYTTVYMWKRTA